MGAKTRWAWRSAQSLPGPDVGWGAATCGHCPRRGEGMGYKINRFLTTGSCYEIYGKNKEGKNIEIYFNPVDGSVVKKRVG